MNDSAQRAKALDISQSFIVQAPAGSGKTELLTQRYLKLLTVCKNPENVIAMTFTNKAVDELTERVLSALRSAKQARPKQPHKQTTYDLAKKVLVHSDANDWQLLQNPKRLKILTIDGLSSLISGRYPLVSQPVPYQILSQPWQQKQAYRYATEQTLLLIEDEQYSKTIADLLLYLDNHVEKFYRLLIEMLSKRDQWLMRLYRDDTFNKEVLQNSAKWIIEQHLSQLVEIAKTYLNERFFALLSSADEPEYQAIQSLPGCAVEDLAKWQSIRSFCLTKSATWRKTLNKNNGFPPTLKAEKEQLIEQLSLLSESVPLTVALQELAYLPDFNLSQTQADILATIAEVLKLCVAQLQLYFSQQQAGDFIEVALLANHALDERSGISDIALLLDYKVQHLLIDEFQDTSFSQFNTLKKMISPWQIEDGKTLFLVGDPMQSIYRFRESQVGLFLQVKAQGIAAIKPISLVLRTNFRSSQSIVEGNNRFFSQLFPENEDIYQGAIPYASSTADSKSTNDQAIVFHLLEHQQFQSEAQTVLGIVNRSLAEHPSDEVAILVRSRAHLGAITQTLKQHNIAFESLKTTPLKNHLLTRDLFSLTKALIHLGDKLAWLSVLRSPWCGLKLQDLLVLSTSQKHTIYQQLAEPEVLKNLTQDGKTRAIHLRACLQDSINNQGRFSFVELLTHALNQLGVIPSLSLPEVAIKNQFLRVVHECEKRQLLNPETIEYSLDDLYAPSTKAPVKLMTIHQSKGLEFDCVIIPGLGRKPRPSTSPIIHLKAFADESLLLAPISAVAESDESATYKYLKFIEDRQNHFETMRLLYVASTRAKKNLHLLGAPAASGQPAKNSLLAFLMPFYNPSFAPAESSVTPPEPEQTAPLLQRFKCLKTPTNKPETHRESVAYQQNLERLFKQLLGTMVHQYLQYELFTPSEQSVINRLIEIGTPPSELKKYTALVLQLLTNTQQDEKFNWLFKPRASTLTEAEFPADGRFIIIDRLFIDGDILWIIDFKTAAPNNNEPLEKFIDRQTAEHKKQLLFYQATLSKIYPNKIKCALYCPAVQKLIEIK